MKGDSNSTMGQTEEYEGSHVQEVVKDGGGTVILITDSKEKYGSVELEKGKGIQRQQSCDVCDFETAITATGYGKYNCLLMAASFFAFLSSIFCTSTISLILPSAGCYLNLSNVEKGMLNAVVYVGMIISAFFWGFLCDTLGRKRLLVVGFLLEGCCVMVAGFAQSYPVLLAGKLCSGFISSGPYAIMMSYLAECHATKHRPSIILWTGIFSSVGTVGLPGMAWLIIPSTLHVELFDGAIILPSWRIFLLISALPSVIAFILLSFFDESPKFLMSQGRRDEALKVFQNIYSINTGQPRESYPVRYLMDELRDTPSEGKLRGFSGFLRLGCGQVQPLFMTPHLPYAILVFAIQFGSLFGLNTIRLWMPQIFSSMIENEKAVEEGHVFTSICDLLQAVDSSNATTEFDEDIVKVAVDCSDYLVEDRVYINAMIIGITTAVGYLTSGYLIKILSNKWLMVLSYITAGICCICMSWAVSSDIMLIINCIYVTVLSVASTAIVSVVVSLFPTSLRTMAVSLTMMFGRVGAMLGNVVFPIMLDWDCSVLFYIMAAVIFGTSLITILLPRTKGKALQ